MSKRKRAERVREDELVRIRMYRQGLGDCFLVTFANDGDPIHILIDCGTLGATTTGNKMTDVVSDIATETNGRLDLLVVTHEHKDHVSGFLSEKPQFDQITIGEVWVAWTEDANDSLAQDVKRYEGDLLETVALASHALSASGSLPNGDQQGAHSRLEYLEGLAHFYGFSGGAEDRPFSAKLAKTVNDAMNYATSRAGENVRFLKPGSVLKPTWLPGVRFYVLGPPRDISALRDMGKHGSPDLYEMMHGFRRTPAAIDTTFKSAKDLVASMSAEERHEFDKGVPFDMRFHIDALHDVDNETIYPAYYAPQSDWRRIDYEWMDVANDFALQLDSYTNNTSLAFAVEFEGDDRVLLFPADAQLGNWLSWKNVEFDGEPSKKSAELVSRTVFYKAGHHASHNATPTADGLELMKRDDLVVFIPLDRQVAMKKQPPWQMPADALYERLLEKARGWVVRSDTGLPAKSERPSTVSVGEWQAERPGVRIDVKDLYIDFTMSTM